jgi:hypothetical protein
MRLSNTVITMITLIIITAYSISLFTPLSSPVYGQPDVQLVKSKNLQIKLDDNLSTNAQLTFPVVGQGPYPGILLITGSGAEDMNETAGFVLVNETTGEKDYPPVPLFQIAQYLSERGFAVLRYDKRGVGDNHKILDRKSTRLNSSHNL